MARYGSLNSRAAGIKSSIDFLIAEIEQLSVTHASEEELTVLSTYAEFLTKINMHTWDVFKQVTRTLEASKPVKAKPAKAKPIKAKQSTPKQTAPQDEPKLSPGEQALAELRARLQA